MRQAGPPQTRGYPMQLSVVIPVKNEADNIVPLVDEVEAALAGRFNFEILVVDDGSSDATIERLKAAMPARPRLRVIRHAANRGQSAGVWTGVKRAKGTWIATLDGDGQNDPADLPGMWARLEAEPRPDMVAGHRVLRKDTASKKIASRLANRIRSGLLKDETRTPAAASRCFAASCSSSCPTSITCTASFRRSPVATAPAWSRSRSITARAGRGAPTTPISAGSAPACSTSSACGG